MLLALALTTLLVLIAVAVWRPQWFVVASVVAAPLNVFRGTLGGSIDGVALPHLDLSLFRVCVVLSAIGLAARLVRDRAARTALRPLRPFAALGLVAVAWILYEWSRSVWPLGETLGSTAAFCVVAAIVLGAALTLGVVSARTFYGAAAASALLPLGYALVQAAGPGTDLQKYWRAVPIAGARGGELVDGQFRPASFFLDADLLGMFAVATIALADPRTWARRRWERGAAHALRLVALAVVVVTASTPALVVLIAYAVVRYGRPMADAVTRAGRPLTAAAVAGAAVAVALVAAVPASRGDAISHSLDLWSRFPVNGAGLANFGYVVGQLPDHSSARSFPFTV